MSILKHIMQTKNPRKTGASLIGSVKSAKVDSDILVHVSESKFTFTSHIFESLGLATNGITVPVIEGQPVFVLAPDTHDKVMLFGPAKTRKGIENTKKSKHITASALVTVMQEARLIKEGDERVAFNLTEDTTILDADDFAAGFTKAFVLSPVEGYTFTERKERQPKSVDASTPTSTSVDAGTDPVSTPVVETPASAVASGLTF